MPTSPYYLLNRAVFPVAAVSLVVLLQVVVPSLAFAVAGWLLAIAIVVLGLQRPLPPLPLPPRTTASVETLILSTTRLRLLESAVVHTHDAVVILDAQPREGSGRAVLYVNDAFCRMSGYGQYEVIGQSLYFLRGPKSDPETLNTIREALAAGRPLRVELRNYRKDGSEFWVDLSLVPVPDPAGRAAHWVMIQRDITDQKKAVDVVRRSETLFRSVFETAPAGVALTDADGRYVECNPMFVAMVGRSAEELQHLTSEDIIHLDDLPEQRRYWAEVSAGTLDRYSHAKRYVRPDGNVVWVEFSFAAIRGAGGGFERGLVVALNVTERRKLEEQLRHSQKMEAIGQMAGGVAHDFNNLLTSMMCNLAQIQLPASHPNSSNLVAAEQAVDRAADLTGKLLGYARRNQLVSIPVDPGIAFDEITAMVRHTFDPRIQLVVSVDSDCGPVQADPALLSQVLLNLCLNARDAMPDGGTLTLTAEPVEITEADAATHPGEMRPGRFVRLSVSDTGCGMTDEVKARLFEPFFTTKGVGKGTGLGLPMVQGIVKQHRGWVTCTSTPGVGTRLDLFLPPAETAPRQRPTLLTPKPISVAALQRVPVLSSNQIEPIEQLAPLPNGGSTVLLVDDEPMILDIGRAILEQAGFRVMMAENGAEAVEVFAREHATIDLVLLDVTMPQMSGPDAFRRLVEIDSNVRVLFSTGYSAEDIVGLGGSVGLLNKPYRAHELLATVRAALHAERQPAA